LLAPVPEAPCMSALRVLLYVVLLTVVALRQRVREFRLR